MFIVWKDFLITLESLIHNLHKKCFFLNCHGHLLKFFEINLPLKCQIVINFKHDTGILWQWASITEFKFKKQEIEMLLIGNVKIKGLYWMNIYVHFQIRTSRAVTTNHLVSYHRLHWVFFKNQFCNHFVFLYFTEQNMIPKKVFWDDN